jgi:uncharacterized membrane protein
MGPVHATAEAVEQVVVHDRFWMLWNTLLALVPAVLAVPVLGHRGRRTPAWWCGAALILLFLPNAPYVVTDLVHLRGDVVAIDSELGVVTGILPIYGAFIAVGFGAYAFVVRAGGRYLVADGLGRWRPAAELAVHALCAVGILLGRVARLNSWEPVTEPHATAWRIVDTLTWRGTPVAVVVLLVIVWAGYALVVGVTRSAVRTLGTWGSRILAAMG